MTPLFMAPRTSLAQARSSSMERNPPIIETKAPFCSSSAVFTAACAVGSTPVAAPPAFFIFLIVSMRATSCSAVWAPATAMAASSSRKRSSVRASAASPVTASMRRMPEPMERSPVMMKPPIWPVARQCVPPQSSWL